MTEAAKKARADYMREWRRRNPDKIRKQRERYWTRRAEKMEAAARAGMKAGALQDGRA